MDDQVAPSGPPHISPSSGAITIAYIFGIASLSIATVSATLFFGEFLKIPSALAAKIFVWMIFSASAAEVFGLIAILANLRVPKAIRPKKVYTLARMGMLLLPGILVATYLVMWIYAIITLRFIVPFND